MSLKNRKYRVGGLCVLALSCVVAAGGCAFLLDTDELKEGTGATGGAAGQAGTGGVAGNAGTAGTGGTGATGGTGGGAGQAGAGGTGGEPPRTCSNDNPFECMEQPIDDPCTKDWCDNGTCQRIDHVGDGLVIETDAINLETADEIGPPSLTVDTDGNFYVGFWYRNAADTGVAIRKHFPNPNVGPLVKQLNIVFPELESFHSSPAIAADGNKLLIAVAATKTTSESGMLKMELKLTDLTPGVGDVPVLLDLDDYSDFPATLVAPRISASGVQRLAIWPFHGDIRLRGWTAAGSATRYPLGVTNLVPLPGPTSQPFGAVVEASDKLMVWTKDDAALDTELTSGSGTRLGLTSSAVEPQNINAPMFSLVSWSSKDSEGKAELRLGAADCSSSKCLAETFEEPGIVATEGMRPAVSVRKENTSDNFRRVALLYAIHSRMSATEASAGLVLNLFQLDLNNPDAQTPFEELAYNPPVALVEDVGDVVPADPEKSPYKGTAIAVHPNGEIMIVWVYQPEGESASLRSRRYRMDTCQ
jgi:hypothetical protein